jgi:hypothetical protein
MDGRSRLTAVLIGRLFRGAFLSVPHPVEHRIRHPEGRSVQVRDIRPGRELGRSRSQGCRYGSRACSRCGTPRGSCGRHCRVGQSLACLQSHSLLAVRSAALVHWTNGPRSPTADPAVRAGSTFHRDTKVTASKGQPQPIPGARLPRRHVRCWPVPRHNRPEGSARRSARPRKCPPTLCGTARSGALRMAWSLPAKYGRMSPSRAVVPARMPGPRSHGRQHDPLNQVLRW